MAVDAVKIVGGNGNRRPGDFYPTPKECVFALADFLDLPKNTAIWDPACGDGAIVKALIEIGYESTYGTDILTGHDFLQEERLPKWTNWIITNPPFSLAEKFIKHAHDLGFPFAYLLKIQYFNSAKRKPLFDEIRPHYILPLTWRPDFTGQGNSLMDMMWVVWTPSHSGATLYNTLGKPKMEEQT